MNTTLFRLPLLVSACLLLTFCRAATAEDAEPGLVKDQPASGRFVKTERGYMVPYTATIPGSDVTFQMEPIPGGKFKLGSPASEKGREANEGPQIEVTVEPFWMSAYEVTWAEYKLYMRMHDLFKRLKSAGLHPITDANKADVVTAPSSLYDPTFTFKLGGEPKQPAVTMSQFAAKQYTKWLSGLTGQYYRLPTEAEWEYACRAGSTSAYFFGDDPAKLGDYAWYYDNASETHHNVGEKKPSPWGLFDIHGNVGEWTIDEFTKTGYERLAGKSVSWQDSIAWPTKLYPRVVRGGGWDEDPEKLRCAARRPSDDDDWRGEDPNFPQSPWWFTSEPALSVGFRPIRPLAVPDQPTREKFWRADIEQIQVDADQRIDNEGRGSRGVTNKDLPAAIKKLGD
jgi:formylglycine-generating enzyme required for sulfatase activity